MAAVEQAPERLCQQGCAPPREWTIPKANASGETRNRETELTLAFDTAIAEETGVDHALGKIEAETGHEFIIDLLPDESGIGFIVFHSWRSRSQQLTVQSNGKKRRVRETERFLDCAGPTAFAGANAKEKLSACSARNDRPTARKKQDRGQAPSAEAEAQRAQRNRNTEQLAEKSRGLTENAPTAGHEDGQKRKTPAGSPS